MRKIKRLEIVTSSGVRVIECGFDADEIIESQLLVAKDSMVAYYRCYKDGELIFDVSKSCPTVVVYENC